MSEKRTYAAWYLSLSLTADYGTFYCDKCSREFFHSPSIIYQGGGDDAPVLYKCCCGNCTNNIIWEDHKCTPFT